MGKIEKSAGSVSVIGGSDGPTSVFVTGGRKPTLKQRIQKKYFAYKRKCCAKKITPGAHTMEEVVSFLKQEYGFEEIPKSDARYIREYESLRSSFILQYKPELLGEYAKVPELLSRDEAGIKEFQRQMELREQLAKEIPPEQFDIDLHMLEKIDGKTFMHFILEGNFDYIGGSFSGAGKMRKCGRRKRKIASDRAQKANSNDARKEYQEMFRQVYLYYGVTEADIANRTRRYQALLTTLVHKN